MGRAFFHELAKPHLHSPELRPPTRVRSQTNSCQALNPPTTKLLNQPIAMVPGVRVYLNWLFCCCQIHTSASIILN
jgi:hypothetical protein